MSISDTGVQQQVQGPERGASHFWRGILCGVFSVVFLLTAAGYYLLKVHGFTIFIDQEKLAASVRTKVQARAAQELPVILAKITDDASTVLLANVAAPALTLQIGDKRVPLPPETIALLREQFQAATKQSLQNTLAKFDTAPYANELAESAYQMVAETLAQEIYGRTFRFHASRWLSLPVTVHGATN